MSKLIRLKAIDLKENRRAQWVVFSTWMVIVTIIVLAAGIAVVGQEATPPKKYDTMALNDEYVMPQYSADDPRDFQRKTRAEQRVVRDRIRSIEKNIATAIEGGGFSSISGQFKPFMEGYVIAGMTQTDNRTLAKLGKMRRDFLDDYLSDKVGAARQSVISAVIPIFQAIAENAGGKNFHPAVRLNAILTLGMIDAQPGSRNSGTLPSPSAEAMQILVDVFTDDKAPSYLKIGALAGIERQADFDRYRTQSRLVNRSQIIQEALKILRGPTDTDAQYWLKRRSVQVLGFIGDAGPDGSILAELKKTAADQSQPQWLRFDAIAALGHLSYTNVPEDQAKDIPRVVAEYVAQSLDSESAELKGQLYGLIERNILYEDKDLEKTGNIGDDGPGGRSNRGGGIGAGGGGGLADDGPPQGGGPKGSNVDLGPRVEIATYHLNDARRKVKIIAYTAKQTVSSKTLTPLVDSTFVSRLKSELDSLIRESDVGIKNLDEEELDLDPSDEASIAEAKRTNTTKMFELFADFGERINDLIPAPAPPANAQGGEAADGFAQEDQEGN